MRWTLQKAKNLGLSDVLHMKETERLQLAQFLQTQFAARVRQAKKAGEMPYGIERIRQKFKEMEDYYGISIDTPIMIRGKVTSEWENVPYRANVLNSYISMFQDFFTWKSNTVKGWRDLRRQENIGLFGTHWEVKNGHKRKVINYEMTDEERRKFWNLYHELLKRETNNVLPSDSEGYTNYKGIHESGFASMWMTMSKERNLVDMDATELLIAMEESLNTGIPTFPEHNRDSSSMGNNDPFADELGIDGNDAFA